MITIKEGRNRIINVDRVSILVAQHLSIVLCGGETKNYPSHKWVVTSDDNINF